MRIAGYIEHPIYKITIMHMNHRFALKFENEGIEQTYKIRVSDEIATADDLKSKVTESVLKEVDLHFRKMEETRLSILISEDQDEEEFEEII